MRETILARLTILRAELCVLCVLSDAYRDVAARIAVLTLALNEE